MSDEKKPVVIKAEPATVESIVPKLNRAERRRLQRLMKKRGRNG